MVLWILHNLMVYDTRVCVRISVLTESEMYRSVCEERGPAAQEHVANMKKINCMILSKKVVVCDNNSYVAIGRYVYVF